MFQRSAGAKLLPLNRQSKAINISKITSLKKLLECFPLVEEASQRLIEAQMLQMFNSLYLEIILGLSPAIFLSLCILCKLSSYLVSFETEASIGQCEQSVNSINAAVFFCMIAIYDEENSIRNATDYWLKQLGFQSHCFHGFLLCHPCRSLRVDQWILARVGVWRLQ